MNKEYYLSIYLSIYHSELDYFITIISVDSVRLKFYLEK